MIKYLFGIIMILGSLIACQSHQITLTQTASVEKNMQSGQMKILEKTEIIPGQTLKIEKDEAGMKYVKLLNGDKTVFKYIYKSKPANPNIMDAFYTQYVYFETGNEIKNMNLSGKDLQKIKLTVMINGFRNSSLIPVDKGNFDLKITGKNTLQFHIRLDKSYKKILQKDIIQIIKTDK